jgi:hypothetical protein
VAIYPLLLPPLPDESAFFAGRPVSQGELGALVNRITHQAGRRARRWSTTWVQHVEAGVFARYPPQPNGTAASESLCVLLPTSELSSHLYLALDVSALPRRAVGSYASPLVNVSLWHTTGALIDIGIEWSMTSGTLVPVDPGRAADENCTNTILTSGVRIDDALAAGALASSPRLLSLGTGGGAEVELRILCDSALVLSVSVMEWWEPTI